MSLLIRNVLVRQAPIFHAAVNHLPSSLFNTSENQRGSSYSLQQNRFVSSSPNRQVVTSLNSLSPSSSRRLPASSESLLITEACKKRLTEIIAQDDTFLRVSVEGGGCSGFQYKFQIDKKITDEDVIVQTSEADNKTLVVIDDTSLDILRGSTLDYETELIRAGFRIINIPKAEQGCSCGSSFNVKID